MGRQVLGGSSLPWGHTRRNMATLCYSAPQARRVAVLQHHVYAANDWLSLQLSTKPWPVPSSTPARSLFALLLRCLLAGPQPSA